MKPVKMYPPNGGDPVLVQPANVEHMKNIGWTEVKPNRKKEEKSVGLAKPKRKKEEK
jgi:hypothetical protein